MQLTPPTRRLDRAAAEQRLATLPGWALEGEGDRLRLVKSWSVPDFLSAMALANRLAGLAEAHDHHPVLTIRWGELRVSWWTHSLQGLHENDFLMAAASDGTIAAS